GGPRWDRGGCREPSRNRIENSNVLPTNILALRRPAVLLLHLLLIPAAFYLAFALRFDVPLPEQYASIFLRTAPILLALRLGAFALFGLNRGWWRHVGMKDLLALVQAVSVSTFAFLTAIYFTGQLAGFPRSVLILDWIIAIFLFGGVRFCVRALRETFGGKHEIDRRGTRALIVGAGDAAERLLRQVWQGGTGLRPVGLVD